MTSIKFIASFALLITAVLGTPHPLQVIDIEEDFIPITFVRQDAENYAMVSSESGYGRLTEVGVTVNKGASARLRFDVRVNGISAEKLQSKDTSFESSLSATEQAAYRESRKQFNGGLHISMFQALGLDLNKRVTRETLDIARSMDVNYDEKSLVVRKILEDVVESKVRITGELLATGVDRIPTVATARVKVARISLVDGSRLTVVSNSKDDLVALDSDNDPLPADEKEYEVFDL